MKVGKPRPDLEVDPDNYFSVVSKEGTDEVRFLDCKLCGIHVYDSEKDGTTSGDAVVVGLVAHMEFSHNEMLGPR
jgi:hypothetical protein